MVGRVSAKDGVDCVLDVDASFDTSFRLFRGELKSDRSRCPSPSAPTRQLVWDSLARQPLEDRERLEEPRKSHHSSHATLGSTRGIARVDRFVC
jgi:hypothetical protein